MKILLSILLAIMLGITGFAQTATNFTCNNCDGISYDLFDELDAGKIVVLVWVMPCGTCVLPTKTAYNVAQSYEVSNPGKVVFYLCDDYGSTSCSSMQSWANTNNITESVIFSNSSIRMSDYGAAGMPKMVVLAGSSHTVYDNQINTFDYQQIVDAIDLAILESSSDLENNLNITNQTNVYYDKNTSSVKLSVFTSKPSMLTTQVYNGIGQHITSPQDFTLSAGENNLKLDTDFLKPGVYIIRISENSINKTYKFFVY
jgi:hypothetical protein